MAMVLTVLQPWAHAIIHLGKSVENRSWTTRYRGRLYIHAGQSRVWLDRESPTEWPGRYGVPMPAYGEMTFGAILGYVDVEACSAEDVEDNVWASGPRCWMLGEPVALARPIACAGKQGLWKMELPEELVGVDV